MCTTGVCAADARRSELSRGCSPVMKIEKLTLHELYFGPDVLEAFYILSFNVYNTPYSQESLCSSSFCRHWRPTDYYVVKQGSVLKPGVPGAQALTNHCLLFSVGFKNLLNMLHCGHADTLNSCLILRCRLPYLCRKRCASTVTSMICPDQRKGKFMTKLWPCV